MTTRFKLNRRLVYARASSVRMGFIEGRFDTLLNQNRKCFLFGRLEPWRFMSQSAAETRFQQKHAVIDRLVRKGLQPETRKQFKELY